MTKKSVKDIDIQNKRVLMRVDFNVPIDENGRVGDDTRIIASLPTINYILGKGGSVVLMSHLGRPKGKVDESKRMTPIGRVLSDKLNKKVMVLKDCVGEDIEKAVSQMKPGDVALLENLRFHKGETDNDPEFAKQLANLGDLYVNDAFGTAHRAHASTVGVTNFMPVAVAGFLIDKELRYLDAGLISPRRPFVAILGGAKVSTKIGVIKALFKLTDALVLGGAMTYTFMKALGKPIGNSLCEEDKLDIAKETLSIAKDPNVNLVLPIDHLIAKEVKPGADTRISDEDAIPDGYYGVDIGPKTIDKIDSIINRAGTVLWNGPLGVFEIEEFSKGTVAIANALANGHAISIIGGGDSVAAINKLNLVDKIKHVSTGGGATLEFLEGKQLPGIVALNDK